MVGLPAAQFGALTAEERARRVQKGRGALQAAGAHYVVDTLADLGAVIEDVEARLSGKSAASV
jgi:phosphonoacetaldehyde hydrolase